jgi:hypothetical protein
VCFDDNITEEYAVATFIKVTQILWRRRHYILPRLCYLCENYVTSHARNFHAENLTHLMSLIKIFEEFRYITKMTAIAQSV